MNMFKGNYGKNEKKLMEEFGITEEDLKNHKPDPWGSAYSFEETKKREAIKSILLMREVMGFGMKWPS